MNNYNTNADPLALEEVRKRRLLIDRCDAYLFDQLRPHIGQRVLEIGCGHGNLTTHLLDRELVVATDVDAESVSTVQRRFGASANLVTAWCDIASPAARELGRYHCDTVLCLNALEHIADDGAALANMAAILAPAGRVIIIVPAFQFLYGSMDSSIGHYRRYTTNDLRKKLQAAGLTVRQQHYFNMLGVIGWFVNGRILRQTVPPSSQLRLYNAVFPVAAKVESLLPHFFGLSVISISQRG